MLQDVIVRPVRIEDLDAIITLASTAKAGLTSLPKDAALLESKIHHSIASFAKMVKTPSQELYLFVMEYLPQHKIIGTAAIFAQVGNQTPFYSFEIEEMIKESPSVNKSKIIRLLHLKSFQPISSEIGTLYLLPEFRRCGVGRFLSLSRFLFMAANSQRFESTVIAEMRGVNDDSGKSPFWTHVGKKFFDMKFVEADLESARSKSFIEELAPKQPIYINLLPKEAQKVIGQPHQNTVPAQRLLLKQGFQKTNNIDIFDAGPKLKANFSDIYTIAQSKMATIRHVMTTPLKENVTALEPTANMILNMQTHIMAFGQVIDLDGEVKLERETANALDIARHDKVFMTPLYGGLDDTINAQIGEGL